MDREEGAALAEEMGAGVMWISPEGEMTWNSAFEAYMIE
jgi:hypothetical protein